MGVGILASSVHSGVIPTDVPNLVYWLDSADPLTIDLVGSGVEEWRDKSASAYEFFAPSDTAEDRPLYTGTVGSLTTMVWNESRLHSRIDLPGHAQRTYCWVMSPTDTTVDITMISIGGVLVLRVMADGKFHIADGNVITFPVDCFGLHVWTAEFSGATSKVWKDGLLVWEGDAGSSGATTFRNDIGSDSFGGKRYLGYLPEIAVYSGVLSDVDRQALETYIYSKWAGGLPGAPRLDTALSSAATPTSVALDWIQGVNSSLVTDYIIEKSPDGTTGWTVVSESVSPVTAYTVTGLTTGVIQYFRVKAVNEVGTGAASNVLSCLPGVDVVLDDFERADTTPTEDGGTGLGANWNDSVFGDNKMHISGGSVISAGQFKAGWYFWYASMGSTDHEVTMRMAHTANAGGATLAFVRGLAARTGNGYAIQINGGGWASTPGGDVGVYITRYVNEVEAFIAGPYLLGVATGEWTFRLTAVGSTIKAYVDGVERLSVTDTTHTTGTYVGMRIFDNTASQQRIRWFDAKAL